MIKIYRAGILAYMVPADEFGDTLTEQIENTILATLAWGCPLQAGDVIEVDNRRGTFAAVEQSDWQSDRVPIGVKWDEHVSRKQ